MDIGNKVSHKSLELSNIIFKLGIDVLRFVR